MPGNWSIHVRLAAIVAAGAIGMIALGTNQLMTPRNTLYDERLRELALASELAVSVFARYHADHLNGDLTLEQAQTQARDAVRELRFDDGNYFYAYTYEGICLVLGPMTEREGTLMINVVDPNGVPIIAELINAAQTGGGYVTYQWPRPGSAGLASKIGYALPFEPWGWLVGTSAYVDDVEATSWDMTRPSAWTIGGILLLTVVTASFVARGIARSITKPTAATSRLVSGKTGPSVPNGDQGDRIGQTGQPANAFLANAMANKRLEQEEARHKAEAEKCAAIARLTDKFEASVGEIVRLLSAAAIAMPSTARSKPSIAEETNRQSTVATSAAGKPSTNVDITIAEVAGGDMRVKALAEQAQAISDVVSLVTGIAEQIADQIKAIRDRTGRPFDKVAAINEQVHQVKKMAASVAAAMQQQNATSGEVGHNARTVSQAIASVREASE